MQYETLLTREQAASFRADGWWPDRLLNDYLDDVLTLHPHKTAFTDPRGHLTYTELRDLADHCALGLLDLGVRRGDAVTVQLPNWNEFVIVTLALERIGAVINPVAPIFRQRELRVMLRLAQPVAVVTAASFRDFAYPEMYRQLQAETPSLKAIIAVGGRSSDGVLGWDDLLTQGAAQASHQLALDWLRPYPDDVSELMFTSGTTGEPKGVLHTANTLAAAVEATIKGQRLDQDDDVIHMASTLGHQTGFLYGVRMPLHLGARAVFQDVWEPEAFVRLLESERITFSMGATPFLGDTLRAPNLSKHDISSFRVFVCAGAPIPQPLAEEAGRRLPCRLAPAWGMTENAAVTSVLPDDPPEKIITTDGHSYPGMEVTVRDDEGAPLPPGDDGDLYARGPFTFVGYVQGRRFTEQFFTEDGWFATGDRARIDADGCIRISGRTKDLVIRGGENVPVKEIEDVLIRHPSVRNVAVIGVPDPRLGEIGCACVILEPGTTLTMEDMLAFLADQQMTRQFWPERIEVLSEFPMTPSGKIQKYQLRSLVSARSGRHDPGGRSLMSTVHHLSP
jgi:cyclohexanecarboxylate-CoA ligase